MSNRIRNLLFEPLRVLRNFFLAGILVVVPLGITVWIVVKFIVYFDHLPTYLSDLLNIEFPSWLPGYLLGIILTIAVISFIGFSTQLYVGRKLLELFEFLVHKIPFVSSIYKGIKQISASLVGRGNKLFERVVLIEYPRKGLYSLAFVTAHGKSIGPVVGKTLYYVFVATTPNPTSGIFLIIPEEEIIDTDISVEDAMKLVISSGMVTPDLSAPRKKPLPALVSED